MLITRTSILSGKTRSLEIPVTEAEIDRWQKLGLLIQEAFPDLSPSHREFLLTGITDDEWDETFKDDEE